MNNKTVTSSLALLLSFASVGAQQARAQDAADTSSQVSDSQPPADGQPQASDAPAPDPSAPPVDSSEPAATEPNPYEASDDASAAGDASAASDDSSASEATTVQADSGGLKLRWGAQLGYFFHTDPKAGFHSAKWLPIGAELGLGTGKSPFALVVKADVSPLCFGGHDCSGLQFRGLAGVEVGIQKPPGSVLHMVYLNASLGYRYDRERSRFQHGRQDERPLDADQRGVGLDDDPGDAQLLDRPARGALEQPDQQHQGGRLGPAAWCTHPARSGSVVGPAVRRRASERCDGCSGLTA
jgi:hypothetical protein